MAQAFSSDCYTIVLVLTNKDFEFFFWVFNAKKNNNYICVSVGHAMLQKIIPTQKFSTHEENQ